jgi:CheY-like chemotaxis protein
LISAAGGPKIASMPSVCERTVLVVDDDATIRETLYDLLTDEGYTVYTGADGQDALKQLRQLDKLPCLILLDLMMPVMSGQQFYAEQQRDPHLAPIPVCVISADATVQHKALAFGGEYLCKPMRFDRVMEVVERYCEGKTA